MLAAVYAATRVTGIPMKHQTMVVFGAGAAGVAIADQVHDAIVADGATNEQTAIGSGSGLEERLRVGGTRHRAAAALRVSAHAGHLTNSPETAGATSR